MLNINECCGISGVYLITNTVNHKKYVGSAKRLRTRLTRHLSQLRCGIHENGRLQHAWTKYGECAFVFSVVETVAPEQLISREQFWIDISDSANRNVGYNICPTAGSMLGCFPSEATRKKMSLAKIGRKTPPEIIAIIAAKLRGRKHSPDAIAKMSAAKMGRKQTVRHVEKRAARNRGKKRSDTQKANISAALKGRVFTPKWRAALSRAAKARSKQKT